MTEKSYVNTPMVAIIYEEPQEVARVLRQRFWSDPGQWVEVVKASIAARGGCTDDFPKAAPGFHAWSNGIARMRQMFRREGWAKGDDDGIETIVHHDLKVQVSVMNADSGTSDRFKSPRNRTIKGPAAEKVTDLNDQLEMFSPSETGPERPSGYPTWYLCIFDDGKTVRAELSRPKEFRSGYFEGFSERIFILRDNDWSTIAVSSPAAPEPPEFDITVRRR